MDETRYYVTSLRTSSKELLQHVPDRWSIENSWHWPRDTQLKEAPAFRKDDTPLNRKPGGLMEQSNASLQRGDQG